MNLRRNWFLVAISSLTLAAMGSLAIPGQAQTSNNPTINPSAPSPPASSQQAVPGPRSPQLPGPTAQQFGPTNQNPLNLPTPGAPAARRTTPVSTANNSTRSDSPFSPRLARAPFLLGDSFAPSLQFQDELGSGTRELPQGGGATRSKIAENSSSLPQDRLIFNYNHFHNAIDENLMQSTDVDRFTLGFEKTFHNQMFSVEVRMPFVADNDFAIPGAFSRNGSDVGNLSVTLKGVLTSNQDSLLAAGMTIDTPTGGGSTLFVESLSDPLTLTATNDAVHLSPFLGFLCAPGGGNSHQGFLQIDVPTNANGLQFTDTSGTATTELLEQTLLYVDYSFATELYNMGRSRRRSGFDIRRVLGLAELHYTTTLEDSDVVFSGTANNPLFQVSSTGNRLDVVNITLGLHTELSSGTQIRFGTVAPITEDDDRFFDFEFQAQLNVPL